MGDFKQRFFDDLYPAFVGTGIKKVSFGADATGHIVYCFANYCIAAVFAGESSATFQYAQYFCKNNPHFFVGRDVFIGMATIPVGEHEPAKISGVFDNARRCCGVFDL